MSKAEYWVTLDSNRIQCRLCPHACILADGECGCCKVRINAGGELALPFYSHISSVALDPIEKKPLRHFLPGTRTFSIGFWHCSMRCPFCQNWEIAHPPSWYPRSIMPEELVRMALKSGSPSISFTYSEPTIHIEYVKECMSLAHEKGLATILVTNGNLLAGPARDILSLTDATNVDLKCYSAKTYHSTLGGELEVVKQFIQIAFRACHVEVTSLVVPGILDSEDQMEGIAAFLSGISRDLPLHITAYRPEYHWTEPPMSADRMKLIAKPAFALLNNVYLSVPYFLRKPY
ncbi:MAG: AmmeMemoRadiSam system radical SAM enzyme [Spirochaetaceae bacterium]|nr:AmmeMemoRadiSam system radical SAM enzyme [Spirochaetaceae bacterium]